MSPTCQANPDSPTSPPCVDAPKEAHRSLNHPQARVASRFNVTAPLKARKYLISRASDAQRHLPKTVGTARELAINMIKPGVTGGKVHGAVQVFFDKEDCETTHDHKQSTGFLHALGHGVGLESTRNRSCVPKGNASSARGW